MRLNCKISLIALAVSLMCVTAPISSYAAKYEVVTSTKAMVARDTLQEIGRAHV